MTDNGSPKTPAVTLTPANIALLVTAILGLVSMGVYIRTLSDKQTAIMELLREHHAETRAAQDAMRSAQHDMGIRQDWILRQLPPQPGNSGSR